MEKTEGQKMMEEFLIGLLLGIISMLPVFPDKETFWQWIYHMIQTRMKR
jgi:hypothetical protein